MIKYSEPRDLLPLGILAMEDLLGWREPTAWGP